MTHWSRKWRPPVGVVLVAALVAVPLPALAAGSDSPAPSPAGFAGGPPLPAAASPTQPLLAQAQLAARTLPALSPRGARGARGQAPTSPTDAQGRDNWSFFKSPVGIAVMSAFAVGVGYAIYSSQNDRITSPGKE